MAEERENVFGVAVDVAEASPIGSIDARNAASQPAASQSLCISGSPGKLPVRFCARVASTCIHRVYRARGNRRERLVARYQNGAGELVRADGKSQVSGRFKLSLGHASDFLEPWPIAPFPPRDNERTVPLSSRSP